MVGAAAGMFSVANGLDRLPLFDKVCLLHGISSKMKTGRASGRRRASAALPSGCAASGGSAPNLRTRLRLHIRAITVKFVSFLALTGSLEQDKIGCRAGSRSAQWSTAGQDGSLGAKTSALEISR
jgi:hypothetical protein